MVFTALSVPYLRSEFGEEWDAEAPVDVVHKALMQRASDNSEALVILTQLLAHELTVGYDDYENVLLETVNGVKVWNLVHLKKIIEERRRPTSALASCRTWCWCSRQRQ